MGKIALFSLLFWITGNPFLALFLLLVILYFLDMRYVRLLPDLFRPLRLNSRLAKLRQQLRVNPHDTSAKWEAARILMEQRRYPEALAYLEEIRSVVDDSAEFLCEYGICLLKTGEKEIGEEWIRKALSLNPRVKYGEPYLHLAEAFAREDVSKALAYLQELKGLHSSSAEVCYRLGQLYQRLGQKEEAHAAYREAIDVYKGLPAYKKRTERRWALLARMNAWKQ
ncbi:tetratricopeptide repeat protein [Brevibacillus sp. SYP-B805]|uniref:tetratricopeptide repeat protein n=1 Tax=Brevibacillus sp. SYP-B805 TaxID=1578199 RepID=UPI0013EC38DB|nr:tetratricopeptide repeat protein [Brevibacillus sp. SYP-B805]NGQ95130.1 tetratricopeptide repeat protein [Brevibacillus sp. SYP-B805]